MMLKFEIVILTYQIVSLGKCLYICDCFSAVNGIVIGISHMVTFGKCLYICDCVFAVNGIVISHMVPLGKCLYVCDCFSAVNVIVISHIYVFCTGDLSPFEFKLKSFHMLITPLSILIMRNFGLEFYLSNFKKYQLPIVDHCILQK